MKLIIASIFFFSLLSCTKKETLKASKSISSTDHEKGEIKDDEDCNDPDAIADKIREEAKNDKPSFSLTKKADEGCSVDEE